MKTLSIGKFRGLQQCASPRGTFTCLALDHRQNLRKAINPAHPESVSDMSLTQFKLDVITMCADAGTAVLLDPQYSAAQAVAAGVLPRQTPFIVAVESTGYSGDPTARQSQVLPGWSIEKAKRMGASMVKLLVYFHPDSSTAGEIVAFVQQVADDCTKQDLGIMLEPLSYSLEAGKTLSSEEKRHVVIETARQLTVEGIDVLKAEWPLDLTSDATPDETEWEKVCGEISAASPVPWILLSAAVDYETYVRQVTAACRAGAPGSAVGRAVWQEAVTIDGPERETFLTQVARPRLERLTSVCNDLGRPWTDFYTPTPVTATWYKEY
jgi:tagatose-1,6-bisphosphate aldolase